MAVLQLGDLRWRVDPTSVDWSFQLDTAMINTLGGQVVQILGATTSDLVISGDFGQDHPGRQVSWQLAAAFHQKIKSFMDQQSLPAKTATQSESAASANSAKRLGRFSDAGVIHDPLQLTYHDGIHDWSFKVLVKALDDADGSGSLNITNGKFAYKYKLTLFIVEADSLIVRGIATDYFLSRISEGLGWSQSKFNGPVGGAKIAGDFIMTNGGSIGAFLYKIATGEKLVPGKPTDKTTTPAGTTTAGATTAEAAPGTTGTSTTGATTAQEAPGPPPASSPTKTAAGPKPS